MRSFSMLRICASFTVSDGILAVDELRRAFTLIRGRCFFKALPIEVFVSFGSHFLAVLVFNTPTTSLLTVRDFSQKV